MTDSQRVQRLIAVVTVLTFAVVFLLARAALAAPAHPRPHQISERQAERIAYRKCGPDGTVDWDDNPEFPPPHCNRNGWNGRRYVEPKHGGR